MVADVSDWRGIQPNSANPLGATAGRAQAIQPWPVCTWHPPDPKVIILHVERIRGPRAHRGFFCSWHHWHSNWQCVPIRTQIQAAVSMIPDAARVFGALQCLLWCLGPRGDVGEPVLPKSVLLTATIYFANVLSVKWVIWFMRSLRRVYFCATYQLHQ